MFTFQPINTCENVYFRRMCTELNPKVQFFDRHKVTSVISVQAARVKATLKKELEDKHLALTCDHWTSLAGHNYLGVTRISWSMVNSLRMSSAFEVPVCSLQLKVNDLSFQLSLM